MFRSDYGEYFIAWYSKNTNVQFICKLSVYRILTKSITLISLVDKLYRKNFDETTLKSLISNPCTKRKAENFLNSVKKVFAVIFNHCNRLAHKKTFHCKYFIRSANIKMCIPQTDSQFEVSGIFQISVCHKKKNTHI